MSPLFILYIESFCNIKQDTHTDRFALVFVTVSYKKKKEQRINSGREEKWSRFGGWVGRGRSLTKGVLGLGGKGGLGEQGRGIQGLPKPSGLQLCPLRAFVTISLQQGLLLNTHPPAPHPFLGGSTRHHGTPRTPPGATGRAAPPPRALPAPSGVNSLASSAQQVPHTPHTCPSLPTCGGVHPPRPAAIRTDYPPPVGEPARL